MDEMNTNPCLHAAIGFFSFFFLALSSHCNNGQNVCKYTYTSLYCYDTAILQHVCLAKHALVIFLSERRME